MSKRVYFTAHYQIQGIYTYKDVYVDEKSWHSLIQRLEQNGNIFFSVRDVICDDLVYFNFSCIESIDHISIEEIE